MDTAMATANTMADDRTAGMDEAVAGRTAAGAGDTDEAGAKPDRQKESGAVQAHGRRTGALDVFPQAIV